MNPNDKESDKELMPLRGDAAGQQLSTTPEPSGPTQLNPPRVDPQLTNLTPLERAAEVLRYSVLRAEYWLSPDGAMRRRIRFAVRLWIYVMIAALIAPSITAVIQHVTGWTAMVGRSFEKHHGNSTGAGQIFTRLLCGSDPVSAAVSTITSPKRDSGADYGECTARINCNMRSIRAMKKE